MHGVGVRHARACACAVHALCRSAQAARRTPATSGTAPAHSPAFDVTDSHRAKQVQRKWRDGLAIYAARLELAVRQWDAMLPKCAARIQSEPPHCHCHEDPTGGPH